MFVVFGQPESHKHQELVSDVQPNAMQQGLMHQDSAKREVEQEVEQFVPSGLFGFGGVYRMIFTDSQLRQMGMNDVEDGRGGTIQQEKAQQEDQLLFGNILQFVATQQIDEQGEVGGREQLFE
jgi:hypothetical protein